jgi:DNA repair protein RadA/Sms
MTKFKTIYSCSKCNAQFPKWSGRCLECGAWGTLGEETIDEKEKDKIEIKALAAEVIDFDNSKLFSGEMNRIKTGISEIDRVFGNGIIPGSLTLLAGEPGIGKSTIVAQIADAVALNQKGNVVLYASGEESGAQVKNRLERIGCNLAGIKFTNEVSAEKIISAAKSIKEKNILPLLIIDSIQTINSMEAEGEAGGINQIRAATVKFLEFAKKENVAVILIGHITKDGAIAGPKSLEHIVDTVIYFESGAARDYSILRASKNRFGSINELGIFEMTSTGFKEIKNPSLVFLENHESNMHGSAISSVIEGTRPFLVEVQALVTKTVFGYPQRKASGFDLNRLQVLIAVLEKRANIKLAAQDVILNVVGGIKVDDPALDLAVCAAIISSLLNQPIAREILILGEIGLGGEARNVTRLAERIKEAEKLGFKKAIVPPSETTASKLELKKIKNIKELAEVLL